MENELEIMRVLRLPPKGELTVEVKGNRYEEITGLKNPKNRQLLLAAIGELITFAGGYQALIDAGVAAPLAPQGPKKTLEDQRAEFLASMEVNKEQVANTAVSTSPPEDTSNLPVVDQIDAILQTHLINDPDLQHRSIHLIGNETGGINIDVDGKIYNHPKNLDDKRIQLLIKQAIKEWESK